MQQRDIVEASGVLQRSLAALLAAPGPLTGLQGASLRQQVGSLSEGAIDALANASLGSPLSACFNLAVGSGASALAIDAVRLAAITSAPVSVTAIIVSETIVYLSLVAQAQVLAATDIVSRQDADAQLARLNAAFADAEDGASDNGDMATYQALVRLHAAVVRDLTTRAAPLPRIVSYSIASSMTSLALAQRLYGDASRADELVAMNNVAHPLFMPLSGVALSA